MSRENISEKSRKSSYEIDMIHGALMPKLITFFIPLMFSGMLQLLFNAVDLVVVGRFAGSEPLAAVGATTSLISMFANLFIGISLGANVVAARYIATEDDRNVSETVHTAITIAAIMGVTMMFVGFFLSPIGLRLMDTPDNVISMSITYMRIYFLGMPFFIVYNYGAAILRATGDTKRPLYFLIIAGIINAVLNMILVIIFEKGVAGVAFATIFSQMITCILVLRCLIKTDENYRFEFSKIHINTKILKKIFFIGVPAAIQSVVISFSNVLLQSSVNSFGSISMAGYTAANNLFGFMFVAVDSISQACMSFTSQNYAVRNMNRVKTVLKDCMLLVFVVTLVLGILVYGFGPELLSLYNPDADVIAAGMKILTYTTVSYFLCGFMNCIPGSLRGLGHSSIPMILSIIGTVGIRILWIYVFFPFNRTLDFLFVSYPVSWVSTFIMQLCCLLIVFNRMQKKNPA